jgi:hypothetical protein
VSFETDSELDLGVYEDLLDMAGDIPKAFADLQPRDMIDVQSVIWVVGEYRDGRDSPRNDGGIYIMGSESLFGHD